MDRLTRMDTDEAWLSTKVNDSEAVDADHNNYHSHRPQDNYQVQCIERISLSLRVILPILGTQKVWVSEAEWRKWGRVETKHLKRGMEELYQRQYKADGRYFVMYPATDWQPVEVIKEWCGQI